MTLSKIDSDKIAHISKPDLHIVYDSKQSKKHQCDRRNERASQDKFDEAAFFLKCGIGKPHVRAARKASHSNGTTIEAELIADGLIETDLYYRWMAQQLGLDYIESINPDHVIKLASIDVLLRRNGPLGLLRGNEHITLFSPEARYLDLDKQRFKAKPALRKRLAVASPATIRRAVWQAGAQERVRHTTFALDHDPDDPSARRVMTGAQGFLLALIFFCLGSGALLWPSAALITVHIVLTLFFSGGILLRVSALVSSLFPHKPAKPVRVAKKDKLPVYTLLIALHDEAKMVPAIVSRIAELQWPKSLLDVKYVCEADDTATIDALVAQNLGPECEIVHTPDFGPRTKPKALQYALQGARGELIAVYDAEDKPAPGQLLEAWEVFRQSEDNLACLQAPLAIANLRSNWLAALFALDYSGLFRILIPFLARTGMPIPLGGTSNHFKRAALENVGGWDPYNVTEDADLGMRLHVRGYRTGTIRSATIETAPELIGVWIRQRTRWLKGWAQTWLVAMRRPLQTLRTLKFHGFVVFQLLVIGMLVSALSHPLMIVFIGMTLFAFANGTVSYFLTLQATLMWIDIVNVCGSYLTFVLVGLVGFTRLEHRKIKKIWLFMTPVYWLLLSFSSWRALGQLISNVHLWEKTPHDPAPEWADIIKNTQDTTIKS